MFLTAAELSQLTGYHPNQRARICKWLGDHGIAFTENRLGEPVVLRSAVETKQERSPQPNLDWLKKSA